MKLPAIFDRIIHKAPPRIEQFLSLVLEERYVQAALWQPGEKGRPVIEKSQTQRMETDDWEARTEAADRALTKLDDDETLGTIEKVVLGLSSLYINNTGDVDASVKGDIKKLCKELDLKPVGFVPLHTALVYKLRIDEGVPPTVILLSVSDGTVTVSLYKIGVLAGSATISSDNLVSELEDAFKQWKDVEVLPSRMLLYGTDTAALEEMRHTLLKHPWPTRVAFLHFPKIDILPIVYAVEAVSMAGAAEMKMDFGEDVVQEGGSYPVTEVNSEGTETPPQTVEIQEPIVPAEDSYRLVVEEAEPKIDQDEHANVVMVAPESLGFRKGEDVLEEVKSERDEGTGEELKEAKDEKRRFSIPKFTVPAFSISRVSELFHHIRIPLGIAPFVIIATLFLLLIGGYMWFIPRATVTVMTMPKLLEEKVNLIVDPTGTVVDAEAKTIPGKTQEKIVSGDKTIPVTSKKDKGDPAKGTVTIYNKSLSEKTFKSGSVVSTKGVSFTLDNDVKAASASESFTQRIYGKVSATVTAVKIGVEGNVPADSEFTFKDFLSETAVGRNDQPFTGGISREVTVVTRADYDALVKALTSDLVDKAKGELATSVAGREKLIDSTIVSTVTDKAFQEELDQETNVLHGTMTIKVHGISYGEDDVAQLFGDIVQSKIPQGYALVEGQTTSKTSDVKVKKDNTISVSVETTGVALPVVDSQVLSKALAGKSIKQAEIYLRSVTGVAGMGVEYHWWFLNNRLPPNPKNISISVTLQE